MTSKKCSKCGEEKGIGEFGKDRSRSNGLASRCRDCVSVATRAKLLLRNPDATAYKPQKARITWTTDKVLAWIAENRPDFAVGTNWVYVGAAVPIHGTCMDCYKGQIKDLRAWTCELRMLRGYQANPELVYYP